MSFRTHTHASYRMVRNGLAFMTGSGLPKGRGYAAPKGKTGSKTRGEERTRRGT